MAVIALTPFHKERSQPEAAPLAGELAEEPPQKLCFGGGGFDEVKDEGGCNAKHCGKGDFSLIFQQIAVLNFKDE